MALLRQRSAGLPPAQRPKQWQLCPELAPNPQGKWERQRWQGVGSGLNPRLKPTLQSSGRAHGGDQRRQCTDVALARGRRTPGRGSKIEGSTQWPPITADQSSQKIGAAVGDGQQQIELLAGGGKQRCRLEAKALETLFIGLMAPAQQLLKMQHTSRIRFTETHAAAQQQPRSAAEPSNPSGRTLWGDNACSAVIHCCWESSMFGQF